MKNEWNPSNRITSLVITELYDAKEPVRFQELWKRCREQLSKASFVRALRALCKEDIVERTQKGRKHVEFRLNPNHPDIRESFTQLERLNAKIENDVELYQEIIDADRQILSHLPKGRGRNRIVKAIVFAHASILAVETVVWDFAEADIAATLGQKHLEQQLVSEAINRFRILQKKGIIDAIKADRKAAMRALDDWLKTIGDATNRVMRKSVPIP